MAAESFGHVLPIDIEDEMKRSYIDYAMSVIVARALPDVRDGLKPVHRRILFAMHERGDTPDKPYKKSAGVVGDVLGKYHPHGDVAVYDALVRMAQDFSTRYQLVDGHGNFGSVDGDPPAAMRYTEVRLSRVAMQMLRDIDKDTVDFIPNFDEEYEEPTVMPSRLPNLVVNGATGIAVGMATNIPPHNLSEVIDGVVHLIDQPDTTSTELMQHIKGPDFPTGALIVGREGIRKAYETGRGIVTMRAVARIDTLPNGRPQIVVTEIPFQVNKARLIERIADLVREKRIEGITDLRDESDRSGMRIVMDCRREAIPTVILNRLYKYTPMQQTFGIIMLALAAGRPRVMTLRELLVAYVEHQGVIVRRRSQFDLEKAEARSHILEGLRIALDHLDEVIQLIRHASDPEAARVGLIERFGFSDKQAQAILDLRLQRLTALERGKIDAEFEQLQGAIAYLRAVLDSPTMVDQIIKTELLEVKAAHGDRRRTRIVSDADDLTDEDLIPDEDVVITLTQQGYIKRQPLGTYRSQQRGGRGIAGTRTREEDFVRDVFVAGTHQLMLFFTNLGKVYRLKAHEIPEAGRIAKGSALVNLLALAGAERVTAVIPLPREEAQGQLFMATRMGTVKKSPLQQYASIRANGLIAIGLREGDELIGVALTDGQREILLATRAGKLIRFRERDVRSMGRQAQGVAGVRLARADVVVAMEAVREGEQLLVVTSNGYGKRTPVEEFRLTGRGGQGVRSATLSAKTGRIAGVSLVRPDDEIFIITEKGILIRMEASGISQQGRAAHGVTVMRMDPGDQVVGLARMAGREDAQA